MKQYKRKRHIEENTSDIKPKKFRNYFNKSERQRGKSIAVSGVDEYEQQHDPQLIRDLRWNMEMELANQCRADHDDCPSTGLALILRKIGVGRFRLYKCTCINPDKLTDEDILKRYGYL
jgi:hypothetical protein